MIKLIKNRSLQMALIAGLIFFFVQSTSDIHSHERIWNTARSILSLISGLCFLLFTTWFVFKYGLARLRIWLKLLLGLVFTPVFGFSFLMIVGLGTCSFHPPIKGFPEHQETVRNTRLFVDYIGDQGALGFSAMGVYQEIPFLNSNNFLRTVVVCVNESKYATIDFHVVDDFNIECIHESGVRNNAELPF